MKRPWTPLFVPKAAAATDAPASSSGSTRLAHAICDPLTGLPNRRAIRRLIRSNLSRLPIRSAVDVVIGDLRMPGCDGLDLLAKAQGVQPDLDCLMLVGPSELGPLLDDARQLQVFRYLSKPWDLDLLLRHVEAALAHAVRLAADRLGAEAALLARCSTPADAPGPHRIVGPPRPIEIVDRGHVGKVLMPQSLPTMPGDLWALRRH